MFVNNAMEAFLNGKGIRFTFTTTNTPAHNGVAERMNGVLMEMARAMMLECNAPIRLWGEAMSYAAFIRNNTPQPSIQGQIPSQLLFGRAYEHTKFRVFGCDALLRLQDLPARQVSISFPSRDLRRLR